MKRAIIGGTGVYSIGDAVETKVVQTPYGSVEVDKVMIKGQEIFFLARHGRNHNTPPHLINYRANAMALKILEVDECYATCAVGSMNDSYAPGDLVVLNDYMDFTKNRIQTFYEGSDGVVAHVEMSDPYCQQLRKRVKEAARLLSLEIKGDAVYICTEGPRFETAAEIKMYESLGGDVVGMTNVPEVVLMKELGICYAAVGIVTNWCTGFSGKSIEGHAIQEAMALNKEKLTQAFIEALLSENAHEKCICNQSLIKL